MPYYSSSPSRRSPKLLVAGLPSYLLGAWAQETAPTRIAISQVSLTADVATVTCTVIEGNIPSVGSLINIEGTQSNGGEFNVTNVPITAVAINPSTGQGTVSFALTAADVVATADAGLGVIAQPEVSEPLANGSSVPCCLPFNDPRATGERTINVVVTFPTLPTACSVVLETAAQDVDAQYEPFESGTGADVATVSAGAVTQYQTQFTLQMSRFYRLNVSGLSGAGTVVAKIQA